MDEGMKRAIEGQERSYNAADYEWRNRAYEIVKEVCEAKETFSADDVWEKLGPHTPERQSKRALTGVLKRAQKMEWCEQTASMTHSRRPECNANRISVYYSKLFKGAAA